MTRRQRSLIAAAACSSALLLAVAGCGAGGGGTVSPAPVPSESQPPATQPITPAPSAATSIEPPPAAAPSSPPEISDPVTEPAYRVNKAYRIVPIDKAKSSEKVVLLTFDDGPKEAEMLESMLDTLDKHHAKAIFFVNGYRVKANPDLLKEIDARGQIIGNHSWDHIVLSKEKEEKVRDQIESVQKIVTELTGKTPVFFRPPHGAGNETVRKITGDNGLLFMNWSNGSLDWELGKKVKDKPQAVIDNVLEQLHPGANILMHELEWTAQALDRLLTELEAKGYGFVDPNAIETKKQP